MIEPDDRGHPEVGIGLDQRVEAAAPIWREQVPPPPVDLLESGDAGGADRPQEPIEARADDVLAAQVLEQLAEQQLRAVVLNRTIHQPVTEALPVPPAAQAPPGLGDCARNVEPPEPPVYLPGVPGQRLGGNPDLLGETLDHLGRGGGQVVGDEPEVTQTTEGYGQADPVGRTTVRADPAQVGQAEAEEGSQVTAQDLGRPAGEGLGLDLGQLTRWQRASTPVGAQFRTSASSAASRSACEGRL